MLQNHLKGAQYQHDSWKLGIIRVDFFRYVQCSWPSLRKVWRGTKRGAAHKVHPRWPKVPGFKSPCRVGLDVIFQIFCGLALGSPSVSYARNRTLAERAKGKAVTGENFIFLKIPASQLFFHKRGYVGKAIWRKEKNKTIKALPKNKPTPNKKNSNWKWKAFRTANYCNDDIKSGQHERWSFHCCCCWATVLTSIFHRSLKFLPHFLF